MPKLATSGSWPSSWMVFLATERRVCSSASLGALQSRRNHFLSGDDSDEPVGLCCSPWLWLGLSLARVPRRCAPRNDKTERGQSERKRVALFRVTVAGLKCSQGSSLRSE